MPKVSLINLGCAKNEVDSEEMLGVLASEGYTVAHSDTPGQLPRDTDVVVINTCGFIESARQQSLDTIQEVLRRKERGEVQKVVVAGCLAQRYGTELSTSLPGVDAFLGTGQIASIGRVVAQTLVRADQLMQIPQKPHHRWVEVPTRIRTGHPWSAYLKISEGCDHQCTFCAIPSFRGPHVSKPMEQILAEAETLARQGVRELNLIAQDSTQYGYDLYGQMRLPELLRALSEVEGIVWIRLFYCYPSRVNRGVIEAIATTPKVCHYIDMPLQHADNAMLRAMRRPMSYEGYLKLLADFRAAAPDVAIRTTFIVGFPGETEEQFATLERFLEEAQFDRAGVFEYSVEEGTPSARIRPRVPAHIKRRRYERLMQRQKAISLARNRAWIGREIDVLIEGRAPHDPTLLVGRSFRDAPEIDGQVYVRHCLVHPGTFVRARVIEARPYDLIAQALPA
ncbi:MAG: 30S ribosomal protein S12 methylthiotransferase RimO [Chloroherpetonaceae bacterium]|nr:30S ribosomal protein S12 methylthiotransferase RimO [Chthonomonadaceae bacterium]MDW8208522.1 30S ribosomal protein S12 methylthiotransferase RimO [Chloroherpetonaceae bacterium]